MSDRKCAEAMLRAAERDLIVLRGMNHEIPDEPFGFHVQQAAEKGLKAWIAIRGEVYPLTHSIDRLLELLPAEETTPFAPLEYFTPYATTFRYESVDPEAAPIDREGMIALIESLLERARRAIGANE